MKRGTPNHPKTHHLSAALDVSLWGAVGVLESIWHFGQAYAQAGDIGRHSNEAIARAIGWTADANSLISGLVISGWLDRCACHRLRIHDWPEHADQTVERYLVTHSQSFLVCYDDPSAVLAPDEPAVAVALPCLAVAKAKPSARARRSSVSSGAQIPETATAPQRAVVDAYNSTFGTSLSYTPGNLRASARALAAGYTPEQISAVFSAVRERKTPTAVWCADNNREFEYLIRPAYKHHRTQEITEGPLDKIPNELATGRKAS